MKLPFIRAYYFYGFSSVSLLLGFVAYLQTYYNLQPCLLCSLQRVTLLTLALVFLLGVVLKLKSTGHILLNLFALLIAGCGTGLAGRQVWLQHLPPASTFDCSVSLQYLLNVLPLQQAVSKILAGGAECAEVGWQFLHASLAEWSLLIFSILLFFTFWQLYRLIRNQFALSNKVQSCN